MQIFYVSAAIGDVDSLAIWLTLIVCCGVKLCILRVSHSSRKLWSHSPFGLKHLYRASANTKLSYLLIFIDILSLFESCEI